MHKFLLLAGAFLLSASASFAQKKAPKQPADTSAEKQAGTKPAGPPMGKSEPQPYDKVITDKATTAEGLFIVHRLDNKTYFELPDSLLGRDILLVCRLAASSAAIKKSYTGYAGDELTENVVRFERGPENKIFMRKISYAERSLDSLEPMYRSVTHSNIQPIELAFDIKAFHEDSVRRTHAAVIDVTDAILADNEWFSFGGSKMAFGIGAFQPDKSYLEEVKTFPINTEIKTVKTFSIGQGYNGGPLVPVGPGNITVELNTSMVLLPREPMQPRYADPRVGYFTNDYVDFDADPQGVKNISMITRWRLEPRAEDLDKYRRGQLVEPQKPIVIYIDPTTPAKWVPYLIQGINDWQPAFEKAGFKNAIIGKKAPTPEEDPTWSIDDARHSAVVYKPSATANATGPHVTDPRSGEVIETHINWYHNIMKILHDWYFIQTAAVDPRARKMEFDDSLMGELIRFVSSHEVGHTLGLLHNFGSSSTTPVEKLRDKAWVEAHGHTPSIMDYARFNYVAQPEDSITESGLFPRIGDYDLWAIEWGYRLVPGAVSAKAETPLLNKWVIDKLRDQRYWFGAQGEPDDPRAQNEDLGDDAMLAGGYGIKNLKRILPHLQQWTKEESAGYENLRGMYDQLVAQFFQYILHVTRNIGGRYENLKTVEQPGAVYQPVPAATQRRAMDFLDRELFTTPGWLLDRQVMQLTDMRAAKVVLNLQESTLRFILNGRVFANLLDAAEGSADPYTITELFAGLQKAIWRELGTKKPIDVYRRNLQKAYVQALDQLINPKGGDNRAVDAFLQSDAASVIRAQLLDLRGSIRAALPFETDPMSKYHLQDILERIDRALHPPAPAK